MVINNLPRSLFLLRHPPNLLPPPLLHHLGSSLLLSPSRGRRAAAAGKQQGEPSDGQRHDAHRLGIDDEETVAATRGGARMRGEGKEEDRGN